MSQLLRHYSSGTSSSAALMMKLDRWINGVSVELVEAVDAPRTQKEIPHRYGHPEHELLIHGLSDWLPSPCSVSVAVSRTVPTTKSSCRRYPCSTQGRWSRHWQCLSTTTTLL